MKRFVYMNEKLRSKNPRDPVIAVQTGDRIRNTNRVQLVHHGVVVGEVRFEPKGLRAAPKHHVRAFVEVFGDVEFRYPRTEVIS